MFTKSALVSLSALSLHFLAVHAAPAAIAVCDSGATTTHFVTVTAAAPVATASSSKSSSSSKTNSASTSSSNIGNFGSCSVPEISFAAGFNGRKETAFEATDQTSYPHGSADNIDVISSFICNELTNTCKADATAKATCATASKAADAAANGTGAQADAFNAVFGKTTDFAAVQEVSNTGAPVSGTGSSSGSSGSSSGSSSSSSAAAPTNTAASNSGSNSGSSSNSAAAQSSLTLDPGVLATGFEQNGQENATAGQVPSATSFNNFINFCLTVNKPITNGQQITGGSCNPAPMGTIPSTANMPSSKFTFPQNFGTIQANTPFNITMAISHLNTGNFVNADLNYFAAPQTVADNGDITGHSHVVIEQLESLTQTTPSDPTKFAFFKGINEQAVNGVLSAAVTAGLPAGVYRMASINAAENHQPVLVPIAQHGTLDDMVYFTVTDGGNNAADSSSASGTSVASSIAVSASASASKVVGTASASFSVSATKTASVSATKSASASKGSSKNRGSNQSASFSDVSSAAATVSAQASASAVSSSAAFEVPGSSRPTPVAKEGGNQHA